MWRTYRGLMTVSWREAMAFRAGLVVYLLGSVFPFAMMGVWLTVTRQTDPAGLDTGYFISYYTAAAIVNQLTSVWVIATWDDEIRTGQLSTRLLRPRDPVHHFLCQEACRRALAGAIGIVALIVVQVAVPDFGHPRSIGAAALAVLSVLAAFALNFLMQCVFGMLAFWLTMVRRVYGVWSGIGFFLSGWVAPLDTLPDGVRLIAELSPFAATLATPVHALTGTISAAESLRLLGVAAIWIVILLALYRALWFAGLRRFDAAGS
ncbi:ABC transporter permease [Acrocarpospora pleiomorpha]|uniref:ABC transporter permease n=1 Tax=Acrocarpospora pleiomorpha TaxID=90975 RepID=A0A5M3Y1N9_9ACTN|nr:ABC-2 family transporter protein [Acrocarpospora pleiomorpha]GES27116.1 ABC transporter permease [Acrocarpospora pleiomorpha]